MKYFIIVMLSRPTCFSPDWCAGKSFLLRQKTSLEIIVIKAIYTGRWRNVVLLLTDISLVAELKNSDGRKRDTQSEQ